MLRRVAGKSLAPTFLIHEPEGRSKASTTSGFPVISGAMTDSYASEVPNEQPACCVCPMTLAERRV